MVPPPFDPDFWLRRTTSLAPTFALVTTKSAVPSAARDAELVVMVPQSLFSVTPVVRFVYWVTVPPVAEAADVPFCIPKPMALIAERKIRGALDADASNAMRL